MHTGNGKMMADRRKKKNKKNKMKKRRRERRRLLYLIKLQLYLTRSWGTTNISIICCEQVKCRIHHQIKHDIYIRTHTHMHAYIPISTISFNKRKVNPVIKWSGFSCILYTVYIQRLCGYNSENSLNF